MNDDGAPRSEQIYLAPVDVDAVGENVPRSKESQLVRVRERSLAVFGDDWVDVLPLVLVRVVVQAEPVCLGSLDEGAQ